MPYWFRYNMTLCIIYMSIEIVMLTDVYILGAYLVLSVGSACPQIATNNPGLQKIIQGNLLYVCT